jgi:hypothetical protein
MDDGPAGESTRASEAWTDKAGMACFGSSASWTRILALDSGLLVFALGGLAFLPVPPLTVEELRRRTSHLLLEHLMRSDILGRTCG